MSVRMETWTVGGVFRAAAIESWYWFEMGSLAICFEELSIKKPTPRPFLYNFQDAPINDSTRFFLSPNNTKETTPKYRPLGPSGDGRWWLILNDKPTNISRTWARTRLECDSCVYGQIDYAGIFTETICILYTVYFQSLLDYHIPEVIQLFVWFLLSMLNITRTYPSTWCYLFRCLKRFHCERTFIVCSPE